MDGRAGGWAWGWAYGWEGWEGGIKVGFTTGFGTAPPATDSSEAGLCGEEGFYRHFGTGTLN